MAEPSTADLPPAVVVVGMHRSGTSLVASLCRAAGIDVGTELLGPHPGNEAGHYEDLEFLHWHERVLRANGMGPEGFVAAGTITVPDGLRREAERLVRDRRRLGHPWGWKNPRTTLLLDFWRETLPEAVFVAVVRRPWDVVDSLFRRGDEAFRTNPTFALDVWRHYNQCLLAFAQRWPDRVVVCELERVVERPATLFGTLRDRFGIPVSDPPDCYRPGLLHAVEPPAIAAALRLAAADTVRLYESLRGPSSAADPEADASTLPALDAAVLLWSRLRSAEGELARTNAALEDAGRNHAGLTAELLETRLSLDDASSRAEGYRIAHQQHLTDAGERAALHEAELRHHEAEIHRLEAELAAARERANGLMRQLEELAARSDDLAAEKHSLLDRTRSLEAETARLSLVEGAARRQFDRVEEQLLELQAEHAMLREKLTGESAQRASLAEALATAEATADVLRDDVERLEAACRDNIEFRRQLDGELSRMARSRSWRLTAPLRSLRRWVQTLPARTAERLSRWGRRWWRRLPMSIPAKQRLRGFLFTRLPWAFRWTRSYREWRTVSDALANGTLGVRHASHQAAASIAVQPGLPLPVSGQAAGPPQGVRVIAMHLPQFHRIPENDAWWGEGFTEWTNVRRGRPFYPGHEQPAVPHPDIGYYDLLDPDVLERQAAMARRYGVHAFCFYHYWFDGRRLLEKPLERLLATGRPDFPFCLCWANENWTRTWDGQEREVLVAQRHAPDSDARFIHDLLPFLRDRRYVRVEGRPLVAVYRVESLPDAAATAATWRRVCRSEGIGEIHLAAVRSFDKRDPREFGFDAAIQFPPLLIPAENRAGDPAVAADDSFRGSLLEYEDAVRYSLAEAAPGYTMYRGVMPAWDNTARRMERATAWMHASPEAYGRWLREAIALTGRDQPPDRRLVFVNAWNEWAEGAYLEPNVRHGYDNLDQTAAALGVDPHPSASQDGLRVLVLSHDAHLAGAQMVTLRTVQEWKRVGVGGVRIVCVGGGALRPAFEAAYPTTVLEDLPDDDARRHALAVAADFAGRPPSVVYSSTVVNGPVLEWIRHLGMPIVTHAHELQKSIERWAPGEIFEATRRASDLFMAAAPAIRDNLVVRHGIAADLVQVVPAHIACDDEAPTPAEITALRRGWGADSKAIVVFGCGTTDWRKGPDLFCEIAARCLAVRPDLRFVWAGGDADYHRDWLAEHGLREQVHFLGTRGDVRRLLHATDLFLLSSREDPMPLVALEAAATSLPVVCFAGAGDIPAFVGADGGVVVPMEDVEAATAAILRLADDADERRSLGDRIATRVRATYDSRVVAAETLRLLGEVAGGRRRWEAAAVPLVSVIVPNYEHAPHLPARLASILDQDVANIEIILLDDRSGDDSLAILEEFARREPRAWVVANTVNSGSAFRQWRKGLAQARGRYVWIAESDDAARPGLLRTLVGLLEDQPRAVLAYCQSEMIDERGGSLGLPLEWTADISQDRWQQPYLATGRDELATALIHKNTIPNVSAVVFRNAPDLADLIDPEMRLCGDWLAYVRLCGRGDVAYSPEPLNLWRQRTSHSRTRPPGELEWQEGQRVIREAAGILGLDDATTRERLADFRRRCEGWLAAAREGVAP